LRWFRWRIRTLMVIVAVVAVSAAFEEIRRRGQGYRLRAQYHLAASQQLDRDGRRFVCGYGLTDERLEVIEVRRNAEWRVIQDAVGYHSRLHATYQLAAERPWLPVDSDPPPPPGANPVLASAEDY